MKKAFACLIILFLVGCGVGNNQQTTPGQSVTTNLIGSWSITTTSSTGLNATLTVSLVSSACSVDTPICSFTVTGPACVLADDNTGQGSISGSGNFIYPPQGVLIGTAADPASQNAAINFLFAEADTLGDAAVFQGTGTVGSGTISGNWSCNPQSPICAGESGTFSGTLQ